MLTSDLILGLEVDRPLRIGIGRSHESAKSEYSAIASARFGKISVYNDPEKLCEDLRDGIIDAAVRGDMSSNEVMASLKELFGINSLQRAAVMEPQHGGVFLLAPVGIDEGRTVEEKVEIAINASRLMVSLGGIGRVGVMSGGRESDRGRDRNVDISIDEALETCARLHDIGIDAEHVQITIESAIKDHDVILAPDGIIGNVIFRTLHFLGGAKALGASILNLDKVFIDTSRAKEDYTDSIVLAYRLARKAIR
jgi:putative methanogen marker protein 4